MRRWSVEIKNLTVSYGSNVVFKNLDVGFERARMTGIIGPNGAGKSTLIKSSLGLIAKKQGEITHGDVELSAQPEKIAYVEQRAALDLSFPINVFDVILTGTYGRLGLFHKPGVKEQKAVQSALEQLELVEFAQRQIGELSGGQLQRVFVARAIVQDAEVVILDEPFVGIDMASEAIIVRILKQWSESGKTIIVVHHDLNKVKTYFDNLVIMNHGIVASGKVEETYNLENISKAFSEDLGEVLFDQGGVR
ncbi:MAG: metal ABC transporter ATP-binding protein [Lactobacillaceae bacterium]|nr:metal ABC transporter ATP-binding protein [Lactobacillaceae bacterium]